MTASEILNIVKMQMSGDSGIQIFSKDTSILTFMRTAVQIVNLKIPPTIEDTVANGGGSYFDIPNTYAVQTVVDVVPLRTQTSGATVDVFDLHPSMFAVGTGVNWATYTNIMDFVQARMNLRAIQVLIGRNFAWRQSTHDVRRVYLDDTPAATTHFYFRASVLMRLPVVDDPNDSDNASYIYPPLQADYILKHVTAQLKMTEGRILRRTSGGNAAALSDGADLVNEGTQEMAAVLQALQDNAHSILTI